MGENEATVLVAMTPSERRDSVATTVGDRGHDVVTADDGIDAVDSVRAVDAVLVGDYPERITAAVVNATTPPDVTRPNVLLAAHSPASTEPDERLSPERSDQAVADAVDRAVERATYTERVSAFSRAAVEAATSDRGSHALADRVAGLSEDARAVQSEFSKTDWVATFRAITPPAVETPNGFRSGNRTS